MGDDAIDTSDFFALRREALLKFLAKKRREGMPERIVRKLMLAAEKSRSDLHCDWRMILMDWQGESAARNEMAEEIKRAILEDAREIPAA